MVNIGSSNGFFSDGTKQVPNIMVTYFTKDSAWNDRSPTRSIRPDFELNYLRIAVSHLNL